MTTVIAVANQKGGVGKTTTAAAVAYGLQRLGYSVLAADLDPQAHLGNTLGVRAEMGQVTLVDVLLSGADVHRAVIESPDGIAVIPATETMAHAEEVLRARVAREHQVQLALEPIIGDYDVVILDTPPSLGLWVYSALAMADTVLAPVQTESNAVAALARLMSTLTDIRKFGLNERCMLGGVALTMYDRRRNVDRDMERLVRESVGDLAFQTVIPRDVRLVEVARYGDTSILNGDSAGAVAYRELCMEVAERWLNDGVNPQ